MDALSSMYSSECSACRSTDACACGRGTSVSRIRVPQARRQDTNPSVSISPCLTEMCRFFGFSARDMPPAENMRIRNAESASANPATPVEPPRQAPSDRRPPARETPNSSRVTRSHDIARGFQLICRRNLGSGSERKRSRENRQSDVRSAVTCRPACAIPCWTTRISGQQEFATFAKKTTSASDAPSRWSPRRSDVGSEQCSSSRQSMGRYLAPTQLC